MDKVLFSNALELDENKYEGEQSGLGFRGSSNLSHISLL